MTYSGVNVEKQLVNAQKMRSVVKTMKSLAAVTISQFDEAAIALQDYSYTIEKGLVGYFTGPRAGATRARTRTPSRRSRIAIIFGTNLGLVGNFNTVLAQKTQLFYSRTSRPVDYWVVGEQMADAFYALGLTVKKTYSTPDTGASLRRLITEIVNDLRAAELSRPASEVMIFHNQLVKGGVCEIRLNHLLPLDEAWLQELTVSKWQTGVIPEIVYQDPTILTCLVNEFLFVSLFRTCAHSVVAENGARLSFMEQTDKKIEDMIEALKMESRQLRQNRIDNELFDIISGFEAMDDDDQGVTKA